MRGVHFFMFLVLVPAIVALGHDIYLFYTNYGIGSIQRDLSNIVQEKGPLSPFASLGFIWTQYHEESYKWVVENFDKNTWAQINTFLTYKAFFVGLAFAGFFYVILGLLKILGLWPFAGEGRAASYSRSGRTDEILGNKKAQRFKYKRK